MQHGNLYDFALRLFLLCDPDNRLADITATRECHTALRLAASGERLDDEGLQNVCLRLLDQAHREKWPDVFGTNPLH